MIESRTASMLERMPVILAVTAASYGLPPRSRARRPDRAQASRDRAERQEPSSDGSCRFGVAPVSCRPPERYWTA